MRDAAEFVVDVTEPLRFLAGQGRLRPDELNVQLMPLAVADDGERGGEFVVSSVDIRRV